MKKRLLIFFCAAASAWPQCASYAHYRKVTIDHTKVGGTLANFPLMLCFNGATGAACDIALSNMGFPELKTVANGGQIQHTVSSSLPYSHTIPADLAVMDSDGSTSLAFEVEDGYDPTTGKIVMHVRKPSLSAGADSLLYICMGGSQTTDPTNAHMVWDSNFLRVFHATENPAGGTVHDSTINAGTGTLSGSWSAPQSVNGLFGSALNFLHSNGDYANLGSGDLDDLGTFTWELWVKPSTANFGQLLAKGGNRFITLVPSPDSSANIFQAATGNPEAVGSLAGSVPAGSWTHIMMVNHWIGYSNDTLTMYINGALVNSDHSLTGDWASDAGVPLTWGWLNDYSFNGLSKELRVSNSIRSAQWAATEFANQSSPSTFYGLSVLYPLAAAPAISGLSVAGHGPNSLLCSWTTDINSSSQCLCGTFSGGPYTYQTPVVHPVGAAGTTGWSVQAHSIALTGLPTNTAANAYYCVVKSGNPAGAVTTSSEVHSGTLAPISSMPVALVSISKSTNYNDQAYGTNGMPANGRKMNGDTNYSTWAEDGNIYGIWEDGLGPGYNCVFPGNGLAINLGYLRWDSAFLNATALPVSNCVTNYVPGPNFRYDHSGGPISVRGCIYELIDQYGAGIPNGAGNTIMNRSCDHFATSLAPEHATPDYYPGHTSAGTAGGDVPTTYMWPGKGFGIPVQQCQDQSMNCTWVAGSDGWVYWFFEDTDANSVDLARVRIEDLPLQDASKFSYYTCTQNGNDGIADSCWSSNVLSAWKFGDVAGSPWANYRWAGKYQVAFLPDFNRYLMVTGATNSASADTAGSIIYDLGQYPWGKPVAVGTIPRNWSDLNYMVGFPQIQLATYRKLSTSPLLAAVTITSTGTIDFQGIAEYVMHPITAMFAPKAATASRQIVSNNSRKALPLPNLDLYYDFRGITGDLTLKDRAKSSDVTVTAADMLYFDQAGVWNFGYPTTGIDNNAQFWRNPQTYTLTTPYVRALSSFTIAVAFSHFPYMSVPGPGPMEPIPSNETVFDKGDIALYRNGTTANSWYVKVGTTSVGPFSLNTDNVFAGLVISWDGTNIKVYQSSGLHTLPLTVLGSGTYSGSLAANTLYVGSAADGSKPFYGVLSEFAIYSAALSDDRKLRVANALRSDLSPRGVTLN